MATRRNPGPPPWLLAGGAVAVLIIGLVIGRATTNSTEPAPAPSTPGSPSAPGTAGLPVAGFTRLQDGVPVGYARTKEGARVAAINYTIATGRPDYVLRSRREQILRAITAPDVVDEEIRSADRAMTRVNQNSGLNEDGTTPADHPERKRIGGVVPLSATVTSYNDDEATVSIWTVSTVGFTGIGTDGLAGTAGWETVTRTLRWIAGDWKSSNDTRSEGPVPTAIQQGVADPVAAAKKAEQEGLTYAG